MMAAWPRSDPAIDRFVRFIEGVRAEDRGLNWFYLHHPRKNQRLTRD
jgi:hypothetical protein